MSKSLALSYALKKRSKKMADGGEAKSKYATHGEEMRVYDRQKSQKGVHTPRGIGGMSKEKFGESSAGYSARASHSDNPDIKSRDLRSGKSTVVTPSDFGHQAKKQHHRVIEEARAINPKLKGLAHGGHVDAEDMASRPDKGWGAVIVKEAEGGDIVDRAMKKRACMYSKGGMAANDDHAFEYEFETPANYDDLSLRDDLESHYDAKNSGDELGNSQEDEDRADIISRIMRSRAKKDRMPRPA